MKINHVSSSRWGLVCSAFVSAIYAGAIFGFVFFVTAMSAAFLVTGDGHASAFTYLMISLVEFPVTLLGLSNNGMAFPASIFWGSTLAIIVFFYKIFFAMKKNR